MFIMLPLLNDFLSNRALDDYITTLDELFYGYAPTEDYSGHSLSDRQKIADCTAELKNFINSLKSIKLKGVKEEIITDVA
jgi:hypothetical protein